MGTRRGIAPALIAAMACLALAAPAAAAPFTVTRFDDPAPNACAPGDCSLREAIRAANTAPGADSIALGPGEYALAVPTTSEDDALDGDLDIHDSVTITGAGAGQTVINGRGVVTADRVFEVDPVDDAIDPVVEFADLTITGGDVERGGAASVRNRAQVTMRSVALTANGGDAFGAAIFSEDDAQFTLLDSTVSGNRADAFSGALYNSNDSTMLIERTVFTDNRSDGYAGALYANNAGRITIRDSVFAANSSGSHGGAMYLQNDSEVTIQNTTVRDNVAADPDGIENPVGGGIYVQNDARVSIANSTVSGNRAEGAGGGIAVRNTPIVTVQSSTITANTADTDASGDDGGGISHDVAPTGALRLASTIVAGNSNAVAPDCGGPASIQSDGFNLIGNSAGCSLAPGGGDQIGSPAAPIDPLLGSLAANGGPTETHLPAPSSPAIDTGAANGLAADQRGAARTADVSLIPNAGDGTDVGAVEREVATCGSEVVVRVDGTPGADTLAGSAAIDAIYAGAGADVVVGAGGADCLLGEDDADRLKGAAGKDRLIGGDGKDRLNGGSGKDRLKGGPGNDRLKAVDGKRDRVNCGPGKRDRARVDAKDKVSRSCEKVKLKRNGKRR